MFLSVHQLYKYNSEYSHLYIRVIHLTILSFTPTEYNVKCQQIKCNGGIKKDQNIKENVIRAKLEKKYTVAGERKAPLGGNIINNGK